MSEKPRRYSEREIGAILKRATELQEDREEAVGATPEGLTLDEIEQIARDVGVDTDLVHKAATEMNTGALDRRWHILGAPVRKTHETLVPGHPTDEDLDELVVTIRDQLGRKGSFEKLNGVLTWTGQNSSSKDEVIITPEGNRTRIQSKQFFLGSGMLLFYLPLFFTLVIGSSYLAEEVGMPALLEFVLLTTAMLAVFGLGRLGFKLWTRQQSQKMAALVQSLGDMLESSSADKEVSLQAEIEVPEAVHQDASAHTARRSKTR